MGLLPPIQMSSPWTRSSLGMKLTLAFHQSFAFEMNIEGLLTTKDLFFPHPHFIVDKAEGFQTIAILRQRIPYCLDMDL